MPSFSLKVPSFKLSRSWIKSLYGDINVPLLELPQGQPSVHLHPHLNNLNISLALDGSVTFDAPDFNFQVAPIGLSLSPPTKLFKGEGLHLLRGEDGEIGISFDKNSSRHFFFIGKAPTTPKFALLFKVGKRILY